MVPRQCGVMGGYTLTFRRVLMACSFESNMDIFCRNVNGILFVFFLLSTCSGNILVFFLVFLRCLKPNSKPFFKTFIYLNYTCYFSICEGSRSFRIKFINSNETLDIVS